MIFQYSSADGSRLRISVEVDDELVHLALVGELDCLEATKLADAVADVVRRNPATPIGIDAAGLTFLDSAGIKALLACRRQAVNAGCGLSITEAGTVAYQVLQITGLLDLFEIPDRNSPDAGTPSDAIDESRSSRTLQPEARLDERDRH